jgi:hypothetical protein
MGWSPASDHRSTADTRRRAYDDARALGIPHDAAKAGAEECAATVARNVEIHAGGSGRLARGGSGRVSPYRVPFPWEIP